MYIAIVDYDQDNRVTKYQDYKTQAEADAHVTRVLGKYPKAFTALDPGGGFSSWLVDPIAKTVSNTPHVETQEEKDNKLKVEKDFQRMKEAVLNVTLSWAGLENSMAFLLDRIISRSNYQFGFAIYFAVASADARFNIINKAIVELFEKQKNTGNLLTKEDSNRLFDIWRTLFSALKDVKGNRNTITHGNILPIRKGKSSKQHVRLTPPMFHLDMMKQWSEPQLPGMSINDVEQTAKRINELCGVLVLLSMIVTYIDASDAPTLLKIIGQLEDRLQTITGP
ncbi:MAG: hypothetical protein HY356_03730 [Gammaproteobacteria bacterium]|nr:hypothetical protein [Gammaproteobacteria bacterium]